MAVKSNQAIQVDNEMVLVFECYVNTLRNQIDAANAVISPSIQYLTDEENVSGGTTKAFQENLSPSLLNTCKTLAEKITRISKGTRNIQSKLGDSISARKKALREAEQNMAKVAAKMEAAGR